MEGASSMHGRYWKVRAVVVGPPLKGWGRGGREGHQGCAGRVAGACSSVYTRSVPYSRVSGSCEFSLRSMGRGCSGKGENWHRPSNLRANHGWSGAPPKGAQQGLSQDPCHLPLRRLLRSPMDTALEWWRCAPSREMQQYVQLAGMLTRNL